MRTLARVIAVAAAAVSLSGCLSFGAVDRRGTTIDESIGSLQNRAILINLARASRGEPLYFISPGAVSGQGTTDFKLTNPAFLEGPGMLHVDTLKQLNFTGGSDILDNSNQSQLQISLDATKEFYQGLMTPLSLNEVDLLLNQGFSRELVYYLAIDHAKFTRIDPTTGAPLDVNGKPADTPGTGPAYSFVVYNDPRLRGPFMAPGPYAGYKPSFAAFQFVMQLAMETGFRTEAPKAAPSSGDGDSSKTVVAQVPAAAGAPSEAKGGIQFVLQEPAAKAEGARLCFDRDMATDQGAALIAAAAQDMQGSAGPASKWRPIVCGEPGVKGNTQYVELPCPTTDPFKPIVPGPDGRYSLTSCPNGFKQFYEIEIYPRSVYAMFTYLGTVMRESRRNPELMPEIADYGVPGEISPTGPLLTVNNGLAPECFTAVRYDEEEYCVPRDGAPNTLQLFNLLIALVALKQSPGDIPVTQTVLIAP